MSGYPALRPACDDRDEMPIVLARLADFTAKPSRASEHDGPGDDDFYEDEPQTGSPELAAAMRTRLAFTGLALLVGLCGFVLGRVTSPNPPERADAWRDAPPVAAAPETPTWSHQPLTAEPPAELKTEPKVEPKALVQEKTPPPTPIQPVLPVAKADPSPANPPVVETAPPANPAPEMAKQWSLERGANRAANAPQTPNLTANRPMTLADPTPAVQPPRPVETVAARPNYPVTMPTPQPTPVINTAPFRQPEAAAARQTTNYPAPNGYPTTNYPTGSYPPTLYPSAGSPAVAPVSNQPTPTGPVPGQPAGGNYRYY